MISTKNKHIADRYQVKLHAHEQQTYDYFGQYGLDDENFQY